VFSSKRFNIPLFAPVALVFAVPWGLRVPLSLEKASGREAALNVEKGVEPECDAAPHPAGILSWQMAALGVQAECSGNTSLIKRVESSRVTARILARILSHLCLNETSATKHSQAYEH
jgi:hypothetical protein